MQKLLFLLLFIIIGCLLVSCSSSTNYKDDVYNPQTQQIERHSYTPYYQLNTELVQNKLELSLITHLIKETIPGSYSLKKYTRRLLPNDYMVKSDTMLFLKNLSNKPIDLTLISISVEHKRLPYSARTLSIQANESLSLPLGQITIDLRLTSLNTKIEYLDETIKKKEKQFDMKRIIQKIELKKDKTKEQEVEEHKNS